MKFHYVRDMVNKNEVIIENLETDRMLADLITKALGEDKFHQ